MSANAYDMIVLNYLYEFLYFLSLETPLQFHFLKEIRIQFHQIQKIRLSRKYFMGIRVTQ